MDESTRIHDELNGLARPQYQVSNFYVGGQFADGVEKSFQGIKVTPVLGYWSVEAQNKNEGSIHHTVAIVPSELYLIWDIHITSASGIT